MVLSFFVAVSGPAYIFLTQGVKTTIINSRIPFTAENSNAEYLGNLALQFILGGYGLLSFVGLEVSVDIFGDLISIVPKIIEYELKQFHGKFKNKDINEVQLYFVFNHIMKQTMDFEKYDECTDHFHVLNLISCTYSPGMLYTLETITTIELWSPHHYSPIRSACLCFVNMR